MLKVKVHLHNGLTTLSGVYLRAKLGANTQLIHTVEINTQTPSSYSVCPFKPKKRLQMRA